FNYTGAPFSGVPSDGFGEEAHGIYVGEHDGLVYFHLTSDDGSDLLITTESGEVVGEITDNDGEHGARERTKVVSVRRNQRYHLWVRYFDARQDAVLKLERVLANSTGVPIGSKQVYAPDGGFDLKFFDLRRVARREFQ